MRHTIARKNKKRQNRFLLTSFTALIVTVILVLVLGFNFGTLLSSAHNSSDEEPVNYKYYKSIQIEKGESFWSIAEEYMNSDEYDSIYDYMEELMEVNQLNTTQIDHLQEGDYLTVIYYDSELK